jgi:hypothetical protein
MTEMSDSGLINDRVPYIPTYYAYPTSPAMLTSVLILIPLLASLFGAIHCIAWSFSFPSLIARTLWRVSSLYITVSPLLFVIAPLIGLLNSWIYGAWNAPNMDSKLRFVNFFRFVALFSVILYIPARIVLVGVSFWGLHDIPATGHQTVEWMNFVPHI